MTNADTPHPLARAFRRFANGREERDNPCASRRQIPSGAPHPKAAPQITFSMNDPQPNKRYAIAQGPVNQRTTLARPARQEQAAPSVKARVAAAKARHRLGAPLSQQLSAAGLGAAQRRPPTPAVVIQAIGCTVGATGLLLGAIQASWWLIGAGAALLCGFGVWIHAAFRKRPTDHGAVPLDLGAIVDESDLRQLDAAMETMAAQAPQETIHRLSHLKASIKHCVSLMASLQASCGWPTEDALYVRECIRRYIPDSIHCCLQVPPKDRASLGIDGGKTALDLLHEQIDMVQAQLDAKEIRLTQLAGESLMRQQRFLAAKTTTGN